MLSIPWEFVHEKQFGFSRPSHWNYFQSWIILISTDVRIFILFHFQIKDRCSIPYHSFSFSSLNSLEIHSCEKLIASRLGWGLHALPSLRSFCIRGFEISESFPERELLPSSLTSLEIWNNLFLKSLNGDELLHLIALKNLGIGRCPNLHSMVCQHLYLFWVSRNVHCWKIGVLRRKGKTGPR